MNKLIWRLANRFCKDQIAMIKRLSILERSVQQETTDKIEKQQYIDKPVIVVSNEIADYVVGIGKRLIRLPDQSIDYKLVVLDYITNKELICFGRVYHYTPELLQLLYDTDPRLTTHLIYRTTIKSDIDDDLKNCLSYQQVISLLESNGFYEVLNEQNSMCGE